MLHCVEVAQSPLLVWVWWTDWWCVCVVLCRAFGVFIVGIGIVTSSILFTTIYLLGGFPANTVPIKAAV